MQDCWFHIVLSRQRTNHPNRTEAQSRRCRFVDIRSNSMGYLKVGTEGRQGWRALACIALLVVGAWPLQAAAKKPKVAKDLQAVVNTGTPPAADQSWFNSSSGVTYVRAVVVSNGTDPEMTSLRAAVVASGGSVFMRFYSVPALSVMLPLAKVTAIADRSDVTSISPNRATARTASLLESETGTVTGTSTGPRSYAKNGFTGYDGSGVGIAVLDSGVASSHASFLSADGKGTRVAYSANMLANSGFASAITSLANKLASLSATSTNASGSWLPGVDLSNSLQPGTSGRDRYEASIKGTSGSPQTPMATERTWPAWPPGAAGSARPTPLEWRPTPTSTTSRCSMVRARDS
ncbi:MAG: hypothetical protein IPP87_04155 [Ideonella sp.]|nr:hypothetical protein [Ideonella sp.]